MLDPANVKEVYSGKPGRCCCGCSGKYSDNPNTIKRIVGYINANREAAKATNNYIEDNELVSVDTDTRRWIAYLKP